MNNLSNATLTAWNDCQRDRKVAKWTLYLFLPVLYIVVLPFRSILPKDTLPVGYLVAWLVLTGFLAARIFRARCPTCGERFYSKKPGLSPMEGRDCEECAALKDGTLDEADASHELDLESQGRRMTILGGVSFLFGAVLTLMSMYLAGDWSGRYYIFWGAMVYGAMQLVFGLINIEKGKTRGAGTAWSKRDTGKESMITECLHCHEMLELDETETRLGRYQCPVCGSESTSVLTTKVDYDP